MTSNKLAYRVECSKTGTGPYNVNHGFYTFNSMWEESYNSEHRSNRPTKYNDPSLKDIYLHSALCFGFETLEHLKRWFNEDARIYLSYQGFIVTVYEVPENVEYHSGTHEKFPQVMFSRDECLVQKTLDILEV